MSSPVVGVPGTHIHRMRHAFSAMFLQTRGTRAVLQRLLGHTDLADIAWRCLQSDLVVSQVAVERLCLC